MTVEYMRRFATGLDQYEFAEVRSSDFDEFTQASDALAAYVANGGSLTGGDPVQDKAIQTLEKGGLRTSLPGLSKGGSSLGGGQQKKADDDSWKGVELGKLDDGTIITFHETGKYGPYFKARNIPGQEKAKFANAPKGLAPHQATLEVALEAFNG